MLGTNESIEIQLDLKSKKGDNSGLLTKSYEKLSNPFSSTIQETNYSQDIEFENGKIIKSTISS